MRPRRRRRRERRADERRGPSKAFKAGRRGSVLTIWGGASDAWDIERTCFHRRVWDDNLLLAACTEHFQGRRWDVSLVIHHGMRTLCRGCATGMRLGARFADPDAIALLKVPPLQGWGDS
eukprot:2814986-Prymnesium_polylepis.1